MVLLGLRSGFERTFRLATSKRDDRHTESVMKSPHRIRSRIVVPSAYSAASRSSQDNHR